MKRRSFISSSLILGASLPLGLILPRTGNRSRRLLSGTETVEQVRLANFWKQVPTFPSSLWRIYSKTGKTHAARF